MEMKSPLEMEWQYGELPAVEEVFYDCMIVLWEDDGYIGYIFPHGDKLNPLRWCDNGYMPRWGKDLPKGWWAWIKEGSQPRPPEVKTWEEHFAPEPIPKRPDPNNWDKFNATK